MNDAVRPGADPFIPLANEESAPITSQSAAERADAEVWEPFLPAPREPPDAPGILHWKLGPAVARWVYRDATGAPLFAVVRFNLPDGNKEILPYTFGHRVWTTRSGNRRNVTGWHFRRPKAPVPIYGLDKLAERPGAHVLICEGEKTADAAAFLFTDMVCITSQGGSLAASNADWMPLAGRPVTIWPDHDVAGVNYATEVTRLAQKAGAASVRVVAVPSGWPPGWDLADDRPEGVSANTLREMLNDAPVVEDVPDPLHGLVEKAAADPGAAFMPEVLERLAALKKNDRATFETLRTQLKKAGCRVTELDRAMAADTGGADGRDPTQTDILIDLAQTAELFHTPDGTGFADLDITDHRETWPIRSKGFRRWLARGYYEATEGAPSSEALQSALNVIEAKAHFDAPERTVHIRVGGLDGRLYLDLVDETWRAVEIDATGWRVVDSPPVRFRRAAGMQPLPVPVCGGSITALRSFLNVKTDTDFVLVVAWLLAALRDRGPYPVLVLSGEQGSAKSTFAAILRALIDPNTAPLRALPREDRDLFITASNGHVLAFDNVSGLPAWISDTLCRLATGGGFAVRQLYTDQDEVLFDACRPVILNGIEDIVTRPDLADRGLFQTLEPIPEERRRPEAKLWNEFEAERPRILGALLDAVVVGLRRLPETRLDKLPRMADFALWATACETAFSPVGTFWSAYSGNRDEAVESVIDADPVAAAVRAVMVTRTVWTGTASDLLGALAEAAGERVAKSKTWPDSPRALSGRLRRAATFLRTIGIEISFEREGRARTRTIVITAAPSQSAPNNAGVQPSASSAPSATAPNSNPTNGFATQRPRTVATDADGLADGSSLAGAPTVRAEPLESMGWTTADGADANLPPQSAPKKPEAPGWSARV